MKWYDTIWISLAVILFVVYWIVCYLPLIILIRIFPSNRFFKNLFSKRI